MMTGFSVSSKVKDIILQSWSKGTRMQYKGPILKWFDYCKVKNIDPYEARFEDAAEFLAEDFSNSSKKYSAMNTARSALSAVLKPKDGFTFGKHPLTCRILKGMFRMRPSLPEFTVVYDALFSTFWQTSQSWTFLHSHSS